MQLLIGDCTAFSVLAEHTKLDNDDEDDDDDDDDDDDNNISNYIYKKQ